MRLLYVFRTRVGPFYIGELDGRFWPIFNDERLGNYADPSQAAADLAGGHTYPVFFDVDTSTLGIPADIQQWERLP